MSVSERNHIDTAGAAGRAADQLIIDSIELDGDGPVTSHQAPNGLDEPAFHHRRRLSTGPDGLRGELDRRARQIRKACRSLATLEPLAEVADGERLRLQQQLVRLVPDIEEAGRLLSRAIEAAKSGDMSADISTKFDKTSAKLNELEELSDALIVNMMTIRGVWEQYARAVLEAQRIKNVRGE